MTRHFSVLLLLAASCAGKDDVTVRDAPVGDADTDTDSDADTDSDTDTDVAISPFGLDSRPTVTTCIAPDAPASTGTARLTRFTSLAFPAAIGLIQAPGDGDHWYVIRQNGTVVRFVDDPNASTSTTVLNLTGPVEDGGEEGLLGIAFHPDFQNNGYVYLSYTTRDPGHLISRVSRFHTDDSGATFDPASELPIFQISQPYSNHNGGWIEFGPDGYLYASFGDGGSEHDPDLIGQDLTTNLSKIIRIDVNNPSAGNEYGIPADNPFASGLGGTPETYAFGLRNPYRFHFDSVSGDLYVGDVGQDNWEEVDQVELGGNYGWSCKEGVVAGDNANGPGCHSGALIPPLAVYKHTGSASVMGGVVYHGTAIGGLQGQYIYNDYYTGTVYALGYDPVSGQPKPYQLINNSGLTIGHWAYGDDGEVYALDHDNGVYRLDPQGGVVDTFPTTLTATGCVDPSDPTVANDQMIPYDLNHPFWSDGADKTRWMAIPDGTTLSVDAEGDVIFPTGTVLMKRFEKDGVLIETRLMMLHPSGLWGGYSYQWRADHSDADLTDAATAVALPSQTWTIPSRAECLQCHTSVASGALGPEIRQLNMNFTYDSTGRTSNEIATLDHIGMFDASPGDPATLAAFAAIDDASASTEDRARAWLHVNCSQCHQPSGPTPVDLDLRFDTALADMHVCDTPTEGDLGLGVDGKVVVPGDPGLSILSARIHRRDANGMPPMGTSLVDDVGAGVVDDWIAGLATCP